MIRISKSSSDIIENISRKHWIFLKCQLKGRLDDSLTRRTFDVFEIHLRSDIEKMLRWFKKNLFKIVMGKPYLLNKMNKQFKKYNSRIYSELELEQSKQDKPITNYILKIFDYKKFCNQDMQPYYMQEVNWLRDIIKFTEKQKMTKGLSLQEKRRFLNQLKLNVINEINSKFVNKGDIFELESISTLITRIVDVPVFWDGKLLNIDNIRKSIKTEITESIKRFISKNEITPFNFGKYREKYSTDWGPYQLIMELGLNVCPYCNRQYISTYYSKNGRTRGDLDHFFPKSLYPFLSLSFYNLIPSCKVCNSSLKGDKKFEYGKYIHPYEEGFEEKLIFTYNVEEVDSFTDQNKINIELDRNENVDVNEDFLKKANRNKEVFKLIPLYNMHKDVVANMVRIRQSYNDQAIDSLIKQHPQLFENRQEVIEMLLFSHLDLKHHDKKILSKLVRDIAVELKFID
ncbi:TPA: HNH endonuclease [Bacillus cereus]